MSLRDRKNASAGLAIAYSLQVMGRLQMTVSCSIETENHMVAVERLKELAEMPQRHDAQRAGAVFFVTLIFPVRVVVRKL